MEKLQTIEEAANNLLNDKVEIAKDIINNGYPFHYMDSTTRKYTDSEKMSQFIKDGFMWL